MHTSIRVSFVVVLCAFLRISLYLFLYLIFFFRFDGFVTSLPKLYLLSPWSLLSDAFELVHASSIDGRVAEYLRLELCPFRPGGP